MTQNPKIGIVAGDSKIMQCMRIFEPLRDLYNFTIFSFDYPEILNSNKFGMPTKAFTEDPKMPGFMKGLEEQLSFMDVVIGVETSRLASFQALRASRKYGLPIGMITTEYRPFFYQNFLNISAIQNDIHNKAARYWTLSIAAASLLKAEGVASEYIHHVGPRIVEIPSPSSQQTKRAKFRKYIDLSNEHFVILTKVDLEGCYHLEVLLKALAKVNTNDPNRNLIRLIIVGNGQKAMSFKYLAADLGLGKQVLFIHQDSAPFIQDLYAASDVAISLYPYQPEIHEEYPSWILDSMTYGVIPIVESGCQASEFIAPCSQFLDRFTFHSDTPDSLAALLLRYRTNRPLAKETSEEIKEHTKTFLMDRGYINSMVDDLETLINDQSKTHIVYNMADIIEAAEQEIAQGQFSNALCTLEEALLAQGQLSQSSTLTIYGLKGDIHCQLGNFENAEKSYREGMALDPQDLRCLRGLGNLFWRNHSHEQALSFFKKALHKYPDDGLSCFGIGMVYSRLGLSEDAIYWLERSASTIPPTPGAIMALAQTCSSIASPLLGIQTLGKLIDGLGEHPILLLTLGQLHLAQGNTNLGNELIAKASVITSQRLIAA
jgi:tetratricopeptide (TPR) repeat protein